MLPKTANQITNGGIYEQSVKCGRLNCKCSDGKTHTAHYFFTRINGKLRKFYIRKSQLVAFSKLVEEAKLTRKHRRKVLAVNLNLLNKQRDLLKENDLLIASYKINNME